MITYSVKFNPGKYKYVRSSVPGLSPGVKAQGGVWVVGREDTGETVAFTFEENNAAHLCLALNLLDSYVARDNDGQRDILAAFAKLKKD